MFATFALNELGSRVQGRREAGKGMSKRDTLLFT